MSVREKDDPQLYAKIQEQNLLRQYDLLSNCIEIGLKKGIEFFDKYTLWALNYAAVSNISQFGGRYREEPIYVGNHFPPHFKDVPNQMDRFFSVIHENWEILDHPTVLPAYALWRLNWIHPFIEGNGRTARAACYYLICLKHGQLLPGKKIVPERIAGGLAHDRGGEIARHEDDAGLHGVELGDGNRRRAPVAAGGLRRSRRQPANCERPVRRGAGGKGQADSAGRGGVGVEAGIGSRAQRGVSAASPGREHGRISSAYLGQNYEMRTGREFRPPAAVAELTLFRDNDGGKEWAVPAHCPMTPLCANR